MLGRSVIHSVRGNTGNRLDYFANLGSYAYSRSFRSSGKLIIFSSSRT